MVPLLYLDANHTPMRRCQWMLLPSVSREEEFLVSPITRHHHKCSPAEATEPGRSAETEAGLLCSDLAGC